MWPDPSDSGSAYQWPGDRSEVTSGDPTSGLDDEVVRRLNDLHKRWGFHADDIAPHILQDFKAIGKAGEMRVLDRLMAESGVLRFEQAIAAFIRVEQVDSAARASARFNRHAIDHANALLDAEKSRTKRLREEVAAAEDEVRHVKKQLRTEESRRSEAEREKRCLQTMCDALIEENVRLQAATHHHHHAHVRRHHR